MKPLSLFGSAFLFGSFLSCGSSSGTPAPRADQAGTAGAAGDTSTESGGTGGNNGTAGTSMGAGGSRNTAGTGATLANLCPDTDPPPEGYELCRSVEDCPLPMLCQRDPAPPGLCGACFPSERQCELDTDCDDGEVCNPGPYEPCQCMGPGTQCDPRCTADSCGDDQRCNAEGHCEPLPCEAGHACPATHVCAPDRPPTDQHGCSPALCNQDGYACPNGTVCEPGAGANLNGCRLIRCDAGYDCPVNTDCNPESLSPHGCEIRTCSSDSDCDCGACVMGRCDSRLYICEYPAPG